MSSSRIRRRIITSLIFLEILSFGGANSLAPWAILLHGHIALRALGWYIVLHIGLAFLSNNIVSISKDTMCPICTKNLKEFVPVFGPPELCRRCRAIFHKKCYEKKEKRCPICFPGSGAVPQGPPDY